MRADRSASPAQALLASFGSQKFLSHCTHVEESKRHASGMSLIA
jgi:hypothetical protein